MSTMVRYRPLAFGVTRAVLREGAPGIRYLRAEAELEPYAERMTDRLRHWAEAAPDRTFIARRERLPGGGTGDWIRVSYAEAHRKARSIGQGLLARGLGPERPVAILSENGIEHALMALGCLYAGVPYCPVSPPYSLVSQDFEKLRHVLDTLTPGLVFAADARRFERAITATVRADIELVLGDGEVEGRSVTSLEELAATPATPAIDAAMQATGPDTITKFLFTSGSTKLPKAVVNTHRMWCANQQQLRQSIPALGEEPPVLVDWLPWNHTFGGNHNVGIVLDNGGTLYIDDGKPTPTGMAETLRNLREIAPTIYFNVPTGFEAIAHAMESDAVLRRNLLSRVKMFFYSGAALAQPVWDSLHRTQEAEVGERIVMGTGLGMTESGPFALYVTGPEVKSGDLGLPAPGIDIKLIDTDGKTEVRYRGPNITPGYWRAPEATAEAFDEEGFFCTGDAVKWIDESNIHRGLRFDGRIAEDFKLATGTFVSVGPLRARIIAAGAPYVQDAVLTGINLKEVGALIFPTQKIRQLAGLAADAGMREVVESAPVQAHFQRVLDELARTATGSANRIARLHLEHEPPSIDKGEVTDKGSINQRSVLKHRADTVEAFHAGSLPFTLKPQGDKP
ncbi:MULTISPECIES: feruloyl-CoA synthase [unclassified Variovorax]|uniref:feruloyl-CoA synthase n=1 Tax=unclassified Variovorax TaxID=663243 RepID=UPI000838BF32|nr:MULTISPECIES: feruloyl-CoA synthase [unclassified Variovorax]PNG53066.1 3-[(3aS,4S,7aS)-7a-methyl-1,5-dioxo-octahydro-1H-inden-4-yl]propanoyl:CoA ligase [Variovorax sp. B2]PNG53638.1 3-[(3aS,4S,7aS)-7a-methyl-1,5-dioxo-octahydro-1H-inden-4-yl]propanoyl:CoA ligase [Variovorax sp. B4]VTV11073.1 Long-chain-fatty-acid--CoA ligase [Variovorax sp. WDL1]